MIINYNNKLDIVKSLFSLHAKSLTKSFITLILLLWYVTRQILNTPIFGQKRSKHSQFEALCEHSLPTDLHLSSCFAAWALRAQTAVLDFPAVGSKNQQKTPNKPPILNQIRRRNQLQIGLSEPNLRPKFHIRTPYTAGAAAQNVQLQPESSPKNFRRVNQGPEPPNPWARHVAYSPTLNPTTAEPYNQALAKSKRRQSIQPNLPILPTYFPTHKPRTSPIRTGAIDKNLRP